MDQRKASTTTTVPRPAISQVDEYLRRARLADAQRDPRKVGTRYAYTFDGSYLPVHDRVEVVGITPVQRGRRFTLRSLNTGDVYESFAVWSAQNVLLDAAKAVA